MTVSSNLITPALFSNPYLQEIVSNIRARPIPWDGYIRTNLISDKDAILIKTIDKLGIEKQKSIVSKNADQYARVLLNLLDEITRVDILQYTLVLLGDLLYVVPEFYSAVVDLSKTNASLPYNPLLKLLKNSDKSMSLLSSKVLTELLSNTEHPPKSQLTDFIKFTAQESNSSDINIQDLSVQIYGELLRTSKARNIVWENKEIVLKPLIDILSAGKSELQLQYYTLIIFWVITFEKNVSQSINKIFNIVPILFKIIRNAIKEKIIRVTIAILVNLATLAPQENISSLLVNHGYTLIQTLSERKWSDEELISDLKVLQEILSTAEAELTSFDEYSAELESKQLRWSPPHKNVQFWRSNTYKFKEQDYKYLKLLLSLLSESTNTETLSVACHDVGAIITEAPELIKVVNKLDGKTKIMHLMTNSDPDVRYEALKATQIFMEHAFTI